MEVILIEDVLNLGDVGELVVVKPGYARNFLIPRKLAVLADPTNKRRLEHEQRQANFKKAKAKAAAVETAKQLSGVVVSIPRKVGEHEKMFGSVTTIDIAKALGDQGVKVDKRKVLLPEPIKALGEHKVAVRLREGVQADITVNVVPEA